ncbi:MAG: hypothetical protein IH944_10595 [Armatimonadetes bacterium]|nr:hypothetical protein [Armatimonadota bacterium]
MEIDLSLDIKQCLTPWRKLKRRHQLREANVPGLIVYSLPRVALIAWFLQDIAAWSTALAPLTMIWGAAAIVATLTLLFFLVSDLRNMVGNEEATPIIVGSAFYAVSVIPLILGLLPYAFALVVLSECVNGFLRNWKKARLRSIVWLFGHIGCAAAGFIGSILLLALSVLVDAISLLIRPWRLESIVKSKPNKGEFLQDRATCSAAGG